MIITIASHKGGVGKTTTAFHLASFLQERAPTLLLDGDETRNATAWSRRGAGVAFTVATEVQVAKLARNFTHIVIDTRQKPSSIDLRALSEGCDLLIIPTVPATLDTEGLVLTIEALRTIGANRYRVLLTKVPPPPERVHVQMFEPLPVCLFRRAVSQRWWRFAMKYGECEEGCRMPGRFWCPPGFFVS